MMLWPAVTFGAPKLPPTLIVVPAVMLPVVPTFPPTVIAPPAVAPAKGYRFPVTRIFVPALTNRLPGYPSHVNERACLNYSAIQVNAGSDALARGNT